jgi:hypothetical protein
MFTSPPAVTFVSNTNVFLLRHPSCVFCATFVGRSTRDRSQICDRSCDRVAFGWQISFDASKEFVDSQGITQMQVIPRRTILLEPTVRSYTINELSPFTTYSVNVSAIPSDRQYRPPTKIAVTTQMAGT